MWIDIQENHHNCILSPVWASQLNNNNNKQKHVFPSPFKHTAVFWSAVFPRTHTPAHPNTPTPPSTLPAPPTHPPTHPTPYTKPHTHTHPPTHPAPTHTHTGDTATYYVHIRGVEHGTQNPRSYKRDWAWEHKIHIFVRWSLPTERKAHDVTHLKRVEITKGFYYFLNYHSHTSRTIHTKLHPSKLTKPNFHEKFHHKKQ